MTIPQAGRFVLTLFLINILIVSGSSAAERQMSLADCIATAVSENRTIKNAYLDRVIQKYTLRMSEEKFTPEFKIIPSISSTGNTPALGGNGAGVASDRSTTSTATANATEKLPTGATLTLNSTYGITSTEQTSPTRAYGWNASLTQPLLKGGGLEVNLASVRQARLTEQGNILSLKSIITSTLTNVVTSYRSYVQAIKSLEITRQSLERSRELVETNRELIAAGRMAAIEIVQSEADLANQEFNLLTTENNVDAARLALTKAIDIDKNSRITPIPESTIPPVPYSHEQAKRLAFENRPDYLQALLNYENTKIQLMLAKNGTLWDLSLTGTYREDYSRASTTGPVNSNGVWTAGLALTIPFDNLYRASSDRSSSIAADIAFKKYENDLARQRENIEIEVQDALRNAEMNYRQIKLATLARTLSEKKVEIETEKLKAGRSTNFQMVSYQNDLKAAQNNELSAIITYLNALTALESRLGITLERWGIALAERP
jgi:outer membrane protein TolC